MIVEVRTCKVEPGRRSRFLDFFEPDAAPLQRSAVPAARRSPRAVLFPFLLLLAAGLGAGLADAGPNPARDGSRDFDFEFGDWTVELSRLLQPLTGSTEWAEYEGTSIVRKIWSGRANLGELEVEGPTGRIQGLSLRLYNPESRQWNIHWASSRDGSLGPPMIGGFRDGVGEFYNQELFNGRSVYVRFIFSDITPSTFRLEQAFSYDGGKSWEANWIARFERSEPCPGDTREEAADEAAIRALRSELDEAWNERDAADGWQIQTLRAVLMPSPHAAEDGRTGSGPGSPDGHAHGPLASGPGKAASLR